MSQYRLNQHGCYIHRTLTICSIHSHTDISCVLETCGQKDRKTRFYKYSRHVRLDKCTVRVCVGFELCLIVIHYNKTLLKFNWSTHILHNDVSDKRYTRTHTESGFKVQCVFQRRSVCSGHSWSSHTHSL